MSAASVGASRPHAADLFFAKPFDLDQLVASVLALAGDGTAAPAYAMAGAG